MINLKGLQKRLQAVSNCVKAQSIKQEDKALTAYVRGLSDEELQRLLDEDTPESLAYRKELESLSYEELLQKFSDLYQNGCPF